MNFICHQIFGLLGDGDMNELFSKCQAEVLVWCEKNNYNYKLWNKEDCCILIDEYTEFKEMYYSVRHLIMRVDIIRFLILHKYGGIYLDLDIIPNIDKIEDDEMPTFSYKFGNKRKHYEMEIIKINKGNPLLLDYLRYMKSQIEEKNKIDIYNKWKCRYVYQTTGPHSLNRFLKNRLGIQTYKINESSTLTGLLNLKGDEDFISYPSCSYMETI
jgi:mannosyltransferase OCH1-like enzyme